MDLKDAWESKRYVKPLLYLDDIIQQNPGGYRVAKTKNDKGKDLRRFSRKPCGWGKKKKKQEKRWYPRNAAF